MQLARYVPVWGRHAGETCTGPPVHDPHVASSTSRPSRRALRLLAAATISKTPIKAKELPSAALLLLFCNPVSAWPLRDPALEQGRTSWSSKACSTRRPSECGLGTAARARWCPRARDAQCATSNTARTAACPNRSGYRLRTLPTVQTAATSSCLWTQRLTTCCTCMLGRPSAPGMARLATLWRAARGPIGRQLY